MTTSATSTLWDCVIIGGGPAGLSAALSMGRASRRVLVVDGGLPRNRFASSMHTVLGHEGIEPAALLRLGRAEAAQYDVGFIESHVVSVTDSASASEHQPHTLTLTLAEGTVLTTRSVIVTTGITDQLPQIPGLAERWGSTVLHCPYCHGWEVRNQSLGVLATGPMALHQAQLLRQWSENLTFFSAAAEPLEEADRRRLQARGVVVEPTAVVALHGAGTELSEVELADGRRVPVHAMFTASDPVPQDGFLADLELERTDSPWGNFIALDQGGRTSHERIWAAGNIVVPMANVPMSMAAGTMAAAMANMALISEEFDLAVAESNG